jgi:hypothetical protein
MKKTVNGYTRIAVLPVPERPPRTDSKSPYSYPKRTVPPKLAAAQKAKDATDTAAAVDAFLFTPWGLSNGVTGLNTASTVAVQDVSNGGGAFTLPVGLFDTTTTALGNVKNAINHHQASSAYAKAQEGRWKDSPAALAHTNASGAKREAKGNLRRGVFGFARDVLGGLVGAITKVKTWADGTSLFGASPGVGPDVGFGALSSVTYLGSGISQSNEVDRAVDRAHRVKNAAFSSERARAAAAQGTGTPQQRLRELIQQGLIRPEDHEKMRAQSGENITRYVERTRNEKAKRLDALFEGALISQNVYEIVRARPVAQINRFVENFWNLDFYSRQRLSKLLHFSTGDKAKTTLDMSRATNLNTASMRRAVREAVIDAFVAKKIPDEWRVPDGAKPPPGIDTLLDDLKTTRKEALGAYVAPGVAALESRLRMTWRTHPADVRQLIDPEELGVNTLRAIERSGCTDDFIVQYQALDKKKRAELHKILHFGSWRFWKNDASLPTTKYQRADIRVALIRRFAAGTSLRRLAMLKVQYNQKVIPLRNVRTHADVGVDNDMIEHILAAEDLKLDVLKEKKRDAKVRIIYGAANGAAAVAESAVNPGAVTGVSATRAILSAPYLVYAACRGLGNLLGQRNAVPIGAVMREDALLRVLPDIKKEIRRYEESGSFVRRLTSAREFLSAELALSEREINKVIALEEEGKHEAVHAYLARKDPAANILIALRLRAERAGGDADEAYKRLRASKLDLAATNPSKLIETNVRERLARQPGGDRLTERQIAGAVAAKKRILARDNPVLATRLFVDELLSNDHAVTAGASNMLRDFRFNEREINGLKQLGRTPGGRFKVAGWLQDHLLGENLRRRFSTRKLTKKSRGCAASFANTALTASSAIEPLHWRYHFEQMRVDVIDNVGAPGLDSMLFALQQHLVGKTDCSSSKMRRSVMEARKKVLAQLGYVDDLDRNLHDHFATIVQIAAKEFGAPKAAVLIRETNRDEAALFGGRVDQKAPPDAVLCYDHQTHRTFVLNGAEV